jgi:tetratricopeptide (TPR) repeat protein
MRRWLFLFLPLLAACQSAPTERPDTLVDLSTVQSGPRVQADELDGAIRQQPDNTGLLARRATLRLAAGQPTAALRDVNDALAIDDADGELYFLQARALRALGQLPQALAAARRAAENGFNSPELPLLEGETHLAARQYDAALQSLDRTLRLDPDQPAALFYKGLAYAATADTAQALDYLQAARARDPRQPEILHQLAFLLNAYRLPDEAGHYASQGLRLDSTSGALAYDYGRQLELLGRPDSALYYYRRALRLDTTVYRADYRLALAAGAHGQRPAAIIPHLQRALRQNPRLPQARQLLAEALEAQHRLPEALAQFRLLVAENPGNQHWTYKVWKTGEAVRAMLPDSLRTAPVYYRRPVLPRSIAPAIKPQAAAQ